MALKLSEWVGIDLGTTNTVAAIYKGDDQHSGNVEVLYVVESGGTLTDSCVFYDQDSDVVLVGKQAANEKANNPENTICDSKRIMGLAFSTESINEFQDKMKQFKIVNSDGYAAFEFRHSGQTIRQTPIDIAAKVLEKIRETADEWANGAKKYNKAVITVPLKFGQEQLVGTIHAAKMAGFSEVHLVKEPNAAALFYGFKHQRLDGYTMLVFDFGGGTLDISILKVQKSEFEVLATRGKKWLGGRDLDEQIRKEMVKRIKAQFDYDCTNCKECVPKCDPQECRRVKRDMQVLLERCERLKINLSTQMKSSISLDFIGIRGQVHLTREEYEELVKVELNEVIETVNDTLDFAGLRPEQFQELQMTGGSSCTPILLDMLEETGFARDKIKRLEPMHAVAKGAAIVGAQLDEQFKAQLPSMNLVEICHLSIGNQTEGDLFVPMIQRGTKIPCSKEEWFYTVENDQKTMRFDIYEGERKIASKNNHLGFFKLYNLPNGAAGDVSIKLKLSIDRDGILHAEANHKKNIAKLNTNYKEKRVDSDKVVQIFRDAELHLLTDSREEKRMEKKNDLIQAIERAKYKCNDQRILAICTEFETWVNQHPNADFQVFENRLANFYSRVSVYEYEYEYLF